MACKTAISSRPRSQPRHFPSALAHFRGGQIPSSDIKRAHRKAPLHRKGAQGGVGPGLRLVLSAPSWQTDHRGHVVDHGSIQKQFGFTPFSAQYHQSGTTSLYGVVAGHLVEHEIPHVEAICT